MSNCSCISTRTVRVYQYELFMYINTNSSSEGLISARVKSREPHINFLIIAFIFMTDVNYMKLWWKPGVLGFIYLQFNAKQRNRGIKCVISEICRTARLVEWLVNSLNDITISRCHWGEANGNFSGVVFYRAPSEKPKKMRLEWSSIYKIHKINHSKLF